MNNEQKTFRARVVLVGGSYPHLYEVGTGKLLARVPWQAASPGLTARENTILLAAKMCMEHNKEV